MAVAPVENASKEKWSLTDDAFNGLLASLGPDRDSAADQYLEIRRNLVRLFEWRGTSTPEEHADETINRCAKKIAEGEQIRDIATYCIGIARMLLREVNRQRAKEPLPLDHVSEPQISPILPERDTEARVKCLTGCLRQLSPGDRELILGYYDGDKSKKIKNRQGLSQVFGIPAGTLRMRALRLRQKLQLCSESCLRRTERPL